MSGGVTTLQYEESDGVKIAEIYRPAGPENPDSWELGAAAGETRGYHSAALLTPDGRVSTAGSEWNDNKNTPNLSIELFEPDYIAVRDRTSITACPDVITYGQSFRVEFSPRR